MTWTMLGNRLKRRLEWYIVKLQIKSQMQICCSLGRSVIRSMSGHIWARPTRFSRAVNTYALDGDRGRMACDITRSFALSPSILQRGIVSRISHSAVGSLYSLVPDWRISSAGQIVALTRKASKRIFQTRTVNLNHLSTWQNTYSDVDLAVHTHQWAKQSFLSLSRKRLVRRCFLWMNGLEEGMTACSLLLQAQGKVDRRSELARLTVALTYVPSTVPLSLLPCLILKCPDCSLSFPPHWRQ